MQLFILQINFLNAKVNKVLTKPQNKCQISDIRNHGDACEDSISQLMGDHVLIN